MRVGGAAAAARGRVRARPSRPAGRLDARPRAAPALLYVRLGVGSIDTYEAGMYAIRTTSTRLGAVRSSVSRKAVAFAQWHRLYEMSGCGASRLHMVAPPRLPTHSASSEAENRYRVLATKLHSYWATNR